MKKVLLSVSLLLSYSLLFGMEEGVEKAEAGAQAELSEKASSEEVVIKSHGLKKKVALLEEQTAAIWRNGGGSAAAGGVKKKKAVPSEPSEQVSSEAAVVRFPQVHFSPGLKELLKKLISDEQAAMRGAWYRFTLYDVAMAMVQAKKERGVAISLIMDKDLDKEFCLPLREIIKAGGQVRKMVRARNPVTSGNFELMHHKFLLFDQNVERKRLVWTGSFNATGQSNLKNCENAVILDDEKSIAAFEQEFATVLGFSDPVIEEGCVSAKDRASKADLRGLSGKSLNDKRWEINKINFARQMNGIPEK